MDVASSLTPPSSRLSATLLSKDCESYSAKEKKCQLDNWLNCFTVFILQARHQAVSTFVGP